MRLLFSLLVLCLMTIAFLACANPTPEPSPNLQATITSQVQEQLAAIPTATPQPTYTPQPTFTPYPTLTAAPTGTPYPTSRPLPTHTRYPTPPAPTRAPTSEPIWQGTGHWYRDPEFEQLAHELYQSLGVEYDVRMASLDADPNREGADLYLTLGCLNSQPIGYLWPYSLHVPANLDEYMVGIWDRSKGDWVGPVVETSLTLADGETGIYITNRVTLREIVRLLKMSSAGLPTTQDLNAIVYDSSTEVDEFYFWSEFDAAGVADALHYLGCH